MSDLPIFTRKADEEIAELKQRITELEREREQRDLEQQIKALTWFLMDNIHCEQLKKGAIRDRIKQLRKQQEGSK